MGLDSCSFPVESVVRCTCELLTRHGELAGCVGLDGLGFKTALDGVSKGRVVAAQSAVLVEGATSCRVIE